MPVEPISVDETDIFEQGAIYILVPFFYQLPTSFLSVDPKISDAGVSSTHFRQECWEALRAAFLLTTGYALDD